jgi:hypothetical protein
MSRLFQSGVPAESDVLNLSKLTKEGRFRLYAFVLNHPHRIIVTCPFQPNQGVLGRLLEKHDNHGFREEVETWCKQLERSKGVCRSGYYGTFNPKTATFVVLPQGKMGEYPPPHTDAFLQLIHLWQMHFLEREGVPRFLGMPLNFVPPMLLTAPNQVSGINGQAHMLPTNSAIPAAPKLPSQASRSTERTQEVFRNSVIPAPFTLPTQASGCNTQGQILSADLAIPRESMFPAQASRSNGQAQTLPTNLACSASMRPVRQAWESNSQARQLPRNRAVLGLPTSFILPIQDSGWKGHGQILPVNPTASAPPLLTSETSARNSQGKISPPNTPVKSGRYVEVVVIEDD